MTGPQSKSFLTKPLARLFLCASIGLIVLAVGIVGANHLLRRRGTEDAVAANEDLSPKIRTAATFLESERYQDALNVLNPFCEQLFVQENVLGLRTYAAARAAVPEDRNAHVLLAAAALVRLAQIDAADLDSRVRLFELYRLLNDDKAALRYGSEAATLSPGNYELCLRVADAELRTGDANMAMTTADRILAAEPNSIEAASLKVRCLVAMGKRSTEVLSLIEDLKLTTDTEQNRVDRTILSLVLAVETQDVESARLLSSILTPDSITDATDEKRAELLISTLEASGRNREALAVAADTTPAVEGDVAVYDSSRTMKLVYRYLWAGEHESLLRLTGEILNSESATPADEVIVIRFLSCWLNNDTTELQMLVGSLQTLQTHRARIWTPVLASLSQPSPKFETVLAATTEALDHFPQSACLSFIHGQVLMSLGDIDATVVALRRSVMMSPRWGAARLALVEALTESGDPARAFAEAIEAVKTMPHSDAASRAMIVSAVKSKASLQPISDDARKAVVRVIEAARDTAVDNVSRHILDAASQFLNNDTDMADETVGRILEQTDQLAADDFSLLTALATSDSLQQSIRNARRATMGDSFHDLLTTTVKLVREQGVATARESLAVAKIGTQPLPDAAKQYLLAEVLSVVGDAKAKSAWVTLAQTYRSDLRIQKRAAHTKQLANDFAIRQQIVDNIGTAASHDSILWQTESTRLLLDRDDSQQVAAQAALAMSETLNMAPGCRDAWLLSVRAFERLDKPERVLSLCRDAQSHGVNVPSMNVRLAELTPTREEAVRVARAVLNETQPNALVRDRAVLVLLKHADYAVAAREIATHLPETVKDSDDHFTRFSMLAMAHANVGTVRRVLGPVETLAPASDRWFQLWLDITQVPTVADADAVAMLKQARNWSKKHATQRSRRLSLAWRRLAKRSPNPECLDHAFSVLDEVVDSNSSVQEQLLLASLAIKTQQEGVAETIYRRVVKQHEDEPEFCAIALNNLASIAAENPVQLESAGELADRAWMLDQKPEFVDTLVEIRLKQNRPEEALLLLEEGIQKWPQNSQLKRLATRLKATSTLPAEQRI